MVMEEYQLIFIL